MEILDQNEGFRVIQDKKTVDWLVNNTNVWQFDPLTFEGYQRKLEVNHWKKIIKFIEESDFFFPTAIICACDEDYTNDLKLRIVDGQHRVKAFTELKQINPERYDQIAKKELPVIVLEKINLEKEIETFININKKGKKVDTSLATVLNHKISDSSALAQQNVKFEYIAVEIGRDLSLEENNIWENQICFEGNAKRHNQLISINAFVRSTKYLLSNLHFSQIVTIDWNTEEELENCKSNCFNLIKDIWKIVVYKWPELFNKTVGMNSIIQGAIGYSSINKLIVFYLDEHPIHNKEEFLYELKKVFTYITIPYSKWLPSETKSNYSFYSSEAGYTVVAKDLLESMK